MLLRVFHYSEAKQGSPDALVARLADGIELRYGDEVPDEANFDILIAAFPSRKLLEASPNLRALIIPFAGPPRPTQELLREFPHIAVHNTPYNAVPTAETALALMLASAKFIVKGDHDLRLNDWSLRYSERPQLVLQGRTVLILGYGRIGRHLAPVCKALGMNVLGVKRTLRLEDREDEVATVHEVGELHALLPRAQVLLITLPETPETVGLIGEKELALLPKDAVLVNVGRGAVVEEEVLYNALVEGKLAAAGLDVWYTYPRTENERTNTAPSQYPFHELENVVMSPHRAGWLGVEDESRMIALAEMLNRVAGGGGLPNRVDVTLGY